MYNALQTNIIIVIRCQPLLQNYLQAYDVTLSIEKMCLLVFIFTWFILFDNMKHNSEPEVYKTASMFGDGMQPQVIYRPTCSGFESTLTDCDFKAYGSFHPSRYYTAGILCYDGEFKK